MQSPHASGGRTAPRAVQSLCLIATLVLAACTPCAGRDHGPNGWAGRTAAGANSAAVTRVVLADFAEPALLNPALSTESPRVSRLIFDALVQPDARLGTPTGSLAEKWDLSPDGLTYTFHLRPNLKWSDGQPLTADDARFTFDLIRDTAEALQLKTGEVDYAVVQPDALQDLESAGLDVKSYLPQVNEYIGYNLKRPLFQDVRVRQALTYALDRNQIVQEVLFGQGEVAISPITSVSWAFNPKVPSLEHNVEKAQQLLTQAGWVNGPDGMLQKDGKPLQFSLETNSGNKIRSSVLVIAQAAYKKLGIDVQTNVLELSAFNQKVKTQHDFDAAVVQPVKAIDPDQIPAWASSSYPNGQNFVGYSNPEADQILQQAATVPGCAQADRQQLYNRFQDILTQDQPGTFLYVRKTTIAVNKRIQGFDPSPWASDEFGIQNWVLATR